ncbi:MAG: hypothetical protein WD042_16915 [Phycisphaeraceae bacterium]
MRPAPGRFNVLLTEDRPHPSEHWTIQLPRLLEPQGVQSFVVRSGHEAVAVVERFEVHAAVIDLATPLDAGPGQAARQQASRTAGLWLVELFRRLPHAPPVVIVHDTAFSHRDVTRLMHDALRLGAFSILAKPVELEQLLAVLQRLLERQYRGAWPGRGSKPPQMDTDEHG